MPQALSIRGLTKTHSDLDRLAEFKLLWESNGVLDWNEIAAVFGEE